MRVPSRLHPLPIFFFVVAFSTPLVVAIRSIYTVVSYKASCRQPTNTVSPQVTHQRNYGRPRAIYHSAPVPANAAITLISAWTQAASNDQTQPKHNGPTGRVAKDRQTVDRQAADSATDTRPRPPSTAAAAHAAAADEKSHFPSLRAGNGTQSL